jgi:membrane-associated phospholipid phosphatase
MKRYFIIFFLFPVLIFAQDDSMKIDKNGYIAPAPFSFLRNFPGDMADYAKVTFRKSNLHPIAGMTAGTLALIIMDQQVITSAKMIGARFNIDSNSSQKRYFGKNIEIFSQRLYLGFEGPHDLSSAMYFIGDGWGQLGIAGGFWAHGFIAKNNKSKQVGNALLESLLTVGTMTQLIKHITGRESPFVSTAPGGVWRFFPNQAEYHRSVPHYDAYPSGHIAAAMATVTVLSAFYPEKTFIRPIGYTLMGALMFAMLNNGVHWASDYPLGIAIGYSFARIAVKKNYKKEEKKIPAEI